MGSLTDLWILGLLDPLLWLHIIELSEQVPLKASCCPEKFENL
jgi:hypothetical protein